MTYKLVGQEPYQIPSNADLGSLAYQNADAINAGQVLIQNTASISGLVSAMTVAQSQATAGTYLFLNQVPTNLAIGQVLSGTNIVSTATVVGFVSGYSQVQPTFTSTTATTVVAMTSTYGLVAGYGVYGTGVSAGTAVSSISNTGFPVFYPVTTSTTVGSTVLYVGTTTNVAVNSMVIGNNVDVGTVVISIGTNAFVNISRPTLGTSNVGDLLTFAPTVTLNAAIAANTQTQNLLFYPTITMSTPSSSAVTQNTVLSAYYNPTSPSSAAFTIQNGGLGVNGQSWFSNSATIISSYSTINNQGSHLTLSNPTGTQSIIGFTYAGVPKASIRVDNGGNFVINANNNNIYYNSDLGTGSNPIQFLYSNNPYQQVLGTTATFLGTLVANSSTIAISTNTGAFQVKGGIGVGGQSWFGGNLYVTNGTIDLRNSTTSSIVMATLQQQGNTTLFEFGRTDISNTPAIDFHSSGGPIDFDVRVQATGGSTATAGQGTLLLQAGQVSITSNTTATSTTTGALRVLGGVGIGDSLYVGSTATIAGNISAVSPTSGALQVVGGAGISGNLYTGGYIDNTGNYYARGDYNVFNATQSGWVTTIARNGGNPIVISYASTITGVIASTNTTTGSLVVAGGAGIGGDLWVGGNTNLGSNLANYLQVLGSTSGGPPTIQPQGSDSNIGLNITTKNSAVIYIGQPSTTTTQQIQLNPGGGRALVVTGGSAAVNFSNFRGGSTGFNPSWIARGGDNAVGLDFATFNTATLNFYAGGDYNAGQGLKQVSISQIGTTILTATNAVSTTTGALIVTGGVGVGGAVYAGSTVTSINSNYQTSLIATGSGPQLQFGSNTISNLYMTMGAFGGANNIDSNSRNFNLSFTSAFGANAVTVNAVTGVVNIATNTNATSTTTGALIVAGGAGVGRNLWVGGNAVIGSTGTSAANSILNIGTTDGLASKMLTVSDMQTPLNSAGANGILVSMYNGGGIYMSGGAGAGNVTAKYEAYGSALGVGTMSPHPVYITSGDATRMSINSAGVIVITSTTNAVSTNSGALIVQGGVGIWRDLWVGGALNVAGGINATITGVSTTATNVANGSAGAIPYQIASGVTGFIGIATTSGWILTSNGTTATWSNNVGFTINTATNANLVNVTDDPTNATPQYLTFVSASSGYNSIKTDFAGVQFTPSTNLLSAGSVFLSGQSASTSTTSSNALYVAGGAYLNSLYVPNSTVFGGPVYFNGTATYVYSTQTAYTDNILELHVPPTGVGGQWTVDDTRDIGFRFHYYTGGADTNAALVLANDTKYLEWYSSGAEGTSTFAGSAYGTFKTGNIRLAGGNVATTTSSGDLIVTGGIGVAGAAWAGNVVAVNTMSNGLNAANFVARPIAGLTSQKTGMSLYSTFFNYPADTNPRRAADIIGGFGTLNGNTTWGAEYLSFNVGNNGAPNDSNLITAEQMRITTSSVIINNGYVTVSNSTNTGALQVTGGVGVGGDVNAYNLSVGSGYYLFLGGNNSSTRIRRDGGLNGMDLQTNAVSRIFISDNGYINFATATATNISSALQATSTITGALTIVGGLGVGGNIYAGGSVVIQNTANATSTTTGALQLLGGAGIGGNLISGGYGSFAGAFIENTSTAGVYVGITGSGTPSPRIGLFTGNPLLNWQIDNYGGAFRWFTPGVTRMQLDVNGNLAVYTGTNATSTTTGALQVAGGAGFGADVFVGGNLNVLTNGSGSPSTVFARNNGLNEQLIVSTGTSNLAFVATGGGDFRFYTNLVSEKQVQITRIASSVNYLTLTGSTTGDTAGTRIISAGSDYAVPMYLATKNYGGMQFIKGRDATTSSLFLVSAVHGLNTDGGGAAFWRGFHFGAVNMTYQGDNLFPRVSHYFETDSLTTPTIRNFYQTIGNSTATFNYIISNNSGVGGVNGPGNIDFRATASAGGADLTFRVQPTTTSTQYLQINGAVSGGAPSILSTGTDANVNFNIVSKGTGGQYFGNANSTGFAVTDSGSLNSSYFTVSGSVTSQGQTYIGPTMQTVGTDTNIGSYYFTKGAGIMVINAGATGTPTATSIRMGAGGAEALRIQGGPGGVNKLVIQGGQPAANQVQFFSSGSDPYVDMLLGTKDAGAFRFYSGNLNGGTGWQQLAIIHTTSTVNYLTVTGSVSGQGVVLASTGTDANVNINLTTRGAGSVVIANTTTAANTNTGALIVQGGMGVQGTAYFRGGYTGNSVGSGGIQIGINGGLWDDGNFHIHSLNNGDFWINNQSGGNVRLNAQYNGNVLMTNGVGNVQIASTQNATSTGTGALQVPYGGVSMGGNLIVGGAGNASTLTNIRLAGILNTFTFNAINGGGNHVDQTAAAMLLPMYNFGLYSIDAAGNSRNFISKDSSGQINIGAGGTALITNVQISAGNSGAVYLATGGVYGGETNWFTLNNTGTIAISSSSQAISTNTGALQVVGGVGVNGNIVSGGGLYAGTGTTGVTRGQITNDGILQSFYTGDASPRYQIGRDLGISGGAAAAFGGSAGYALVGVADQAGSALYIKLNSATGSITTNPNVALTATALTVYTSTQAISTTTGALQVRGGLGVGGNAYVGGTMVIGTATNIPSSVALWINSPPTLPAGNYAPRIVLEDDYGYATGMDMQVNFPGIGLSTSTIGFDFYGGQYGGNNTPAAGPGRGQGSWGLNYISGRANFSNHWFRDFNYNVQASIVNNGTFVTGYNYQTYTAPSYSGLFQGNVGVGTSVTNATLTVAGGQTITGIFTASSGINITGTSTFTGPSTFTGTSTFKSTVTFVSPVSSASIVARMLDSDVLTFSGARGQLFSISDSFTGTIFGVYDVSGVPAIEAYDTGNVILAETFGNVGVGTTATTAKFTVNGGVQVSGIITGTTLSLTTDINMGGRITIGSYNTDQIWLNSPGTNYGAIGTYGASQAWGLGWSTGNKALVWNTGSVVTIIGGNQSVSTGTGALVVNGGVGIANQLNVGGSVGIGTGTPGGKVEINAGSIGATTFEMLRLKTQDITQNSTSTVSFYNGSQLATQLISTWDTNTSGSGRFGIWVNDGRSSLTGAVVFEARTAGATNGGYVRLLSNSGAVALNVDQNQVVTITTGTNSSNTNTGALVVQGGVGIWNNLWVGGSINVSGTINASVTGVITTATNIAGGTAGQMPFQASPGVTNFTSTLTVTGNVIRINSGVQSTNTGTGALVVTGGVGISGALNATTKSFNISHPTKPGMQLRYGSLEGPEFGVYIRGKLTDGNKIMLPDYWSKLVDPDTITVDITPLGKYQKLFVKEIVGAEYIVVGNDALLSNAVSCFYTVYAERADVDKLEVES